MLRRITQRLRRLTWWQWGLLGGALVALFQLLFLLELWREKVAVDELVRRGVLVGKRSIFSETRFWEYKAVQTAGRFVEIPVYAIFPYETDVSIDAIHRLRWLPSLQNVTFGERWVTRRKESDPLAPAGHFVSDNDLVAVGRLQQIRQLSFSYSNITDAGLEHLTPLTSLSWLDLKRANIRDAGLAHIGRLRSLTRLSIQQTRVTGLGLRHLKSLRELTWLSLQSTQLEEDGSLAHLAELPKLRDLDLDFVPITDKSIEDLSRLKSLHVLRVDRTGLSNDGIEQLRTRLPNCDVVGRAR